MFVTYYGRFTLTSRQAPTPPHQLSSAQPSSRTGERILRAEVRKLVGWDKGSLIGEGKSGGESKAISHAPAQGSDAQPDSKQQPPCMQNLLFWVPTFHGMEYGTRLRPVWVSSPSCLPSPPTLLTEGAQCGKKRRPWHCASSVQQQPKHQCVTNTVLATNPKRSIIQTAMKKINCLPARHTTSF